MKKTILIGSPPSTMKLMIHPFIQHLLGTYCVPVCQALGGWGTGPK